MNLPLFLSRHLYSAREANKKAVSRPAIRIAILGVAVGLAVMLVSVGVVFGFKQTIRDKAVGFVCNLQVAGYETFMYSEAVPVQMNDSMMSVLKSFPHVKHVQRYALKQGILKTDEEFLGVVFKGIAEEFDSTFISQHLLVGELPTFSSQKSSNKIVISKSMADKLKITCGERIFAYFIDESGVRMRRFTIAGVYQTNLTQYDNTVCFTDLRTTVKLNGWENDQATGAEVLLTDFKYTDETEAAMVEKVNRTTDKYGRTYAAKTVMDINPQVFSWLDLLDLNVWIILVIMAAVAAVSMISGLLIIILERTAMIGTLKALGATNRMISKTFLWFAAFIVGRGLIIGNLIGIGVMLLQQTTHIVKLDADSYYVSYVPIDINIVHILLLNAATLLICMFILIAPSYLVAHIHPAKSMRYE